MTTWQDIGTAPRDGRHVMLGMADEQYVAEGYFDEDEEKWFSANTHSTDYVDGSLYPTHWMPLPSPPSKEGE